MFLPFEMQENIRDEIVNFLWLQPITFWRKDQPVEAPKLSFSESDSRAFGNLYLRT